MLSSPLLNGVWSTFQQIVCLDRYILVWISLLVAYRETNRISKTSHACWISNTGSLGRPFHNWVSLMIVFGDRENYLFSHLRVRLGISLFPSQVLWPYSPPVQVPGFVVNLILTRLGPMKTWAFSYAMGPSRIFVWNADEFRFAWLLQSSEMQGRHVERLFR